MNEPTSLFDVRVIVSPERSSGERTVRIMDGTDSILEHRIPVERGDQAQARIDVQAEEREDGASVQIDTELFSQPAVADGGTSGWATIPDDLPDDFDDRDFSGAADSALAWLSNQPKKKDVRTAALDEAGVGDPYRNVTKNDWARLYLELRRRRLAIERLETALADLEEALLGMPGRPDAERVRSDVLDDVDDLGLDLDGHTDAGGNPL